MSLADCFRMDLNLVHSCNETPATFSGHRERPTLRDGFRGRSTHPTRYFQFMLSFLCDDAQSRKYRLMRLW